MCSANIIHVQRQYHTCAAPISYMCSANIIHVQRQYHTCAAPISYMCSANIIHVQRQYHTYLCINECMCVYIYIYHAYSLNIIYLSTYAYGSVYVCMYITCRRRDMFSASIATSSARKLASSLFKSLFASESGSLPLPRPPVLQEDAYKIKAPQMSL
jgi:hypothetical protein